MCARVLSSAAYRVGVRGDMMCALVGLSFVVLVNCWNVLLWFTMLLTSLIRPVCVALNRSVFSRLWTAVVGTLWCDDMRPMKPVHLVLTNDRRPVCLLVARL